MAKHKTNKKRFNFLIEERIYNDFSLLCEEMGLVRSKKLEIYMKEFVEKHKELVKSLKKK